MENTVLELVLPWLTAQELAIVARVSKSMAVAVKKVTVTRTDDAAQGQERWKVPIFNQVDNYLYPFFQYTKHSFVTKHSHGKSRVAWGAAVTACLSGSPLYSSLEWRGISRDKQLLSWTSQTVVDDVQGTKVQETAKEGRQECSLPDYVDAAVGCKCLGSCAQPGIRGLPSLEDAMLASFSTGGHKDCGVTRKRNATEEGNSHRHGGGNSPEDCSEKLMSEMAAARTLGPCRCGRMLNGQLAYEADSKLRVLSTARKMEPSLNARRAFEQLVGTESDSDEGDGSDFEGGPPLILECGSACSCSLNCGLRVSQHGLAVRVSIVRHPLKGWCLHAAQIIAVGSFICEYAGEMITTAETKLRQQLYETGRESGKQKHGPSLLVLKEHLPSVPRLGLFARRNIEEGEELSYNYGTDATKGAASRLCFCATTACRGDWEAELLLAMNYFTMQSTCRANPSDVSLHYSSNESMI